MKRYIFCLALAVCSATIFSASAYAFGNETKMKEKVFAELDADGNGSFTVEDFVAFNPPRGNPTEDQKRMRFEKMDADKDGKVTKEEFLAD